MRPWLVMSLRGVLPRSWSSLSMASASIRRVCQLISLNVNTWMKNRHTNQSSYNHIKKNTVTLLLPKRKDNRNIFFQVDPKNSPSSYQNNLFKSFSAGLMSEHSFCSGSLYSALHYMTQTGSVKAVLEEK